MRVETANLSKQFDGLTALNDVSMVFPAESVTVIIGPNGTGKTTLLNIISGFLKPDSGSVFLVPDHDGEAVMGETDILRLQPHQIALHGVGVLFQDVRVFPKLTALENVAVGAKNQPGENLMTCFFRPGRVASYERKVLEKARHYLDYVGLAGSASVLGEQLSYGQQKLTAIARLLSGDPKVLMLDEPTSGVHTDMIEKLLGLIQQLAHNDGRVVITIEHNLNVVKRLGDWVYLMAGDEIIFGPPNDVLSDPRLLEVFPTL